MFFHGYSTYRSLGIEKRLIILKFVSMLASIIVSVRFGASCFHPHLQTTSIFILLLFVLFLIISFNSIVSSFHKSSNSNSSSFFISSINSANPVFSLILTLLKILISLAKIIPKKLIIIAIITHIEYSVIFKILFNFLFLNNINLLLF
ncbi:hypothetical protein HOG21_06460 [bacterium]|jgi:hypothetical protein|nr:hypothetical protein [bacterium]